MIDLKAKLVELWRRFAVDAVRRTRRVWAQLKKNHGW